MVEADPHRQPGAMFGLKRIEAGFEAAHRAHGVGQHQHFEAAPERRVEHAEHVGVHEGLAAGEADFTRAEPACLVEEKIDFGQRRIDQGVVPGRAFDVAVLAGEIAQGAGVDPQRVEPLHRDARADVALRRPQRVAELGAVQWLRLL
jgi:hypothetical protein